jgi:L-lactate dehydrogenase complex protein LldG
VSAREEVLGRIRTALGTSHGQAPDVSRGYRLAGADDELSRDAVLDELVDRLVDYKATVHRCTAADLTGTLAGAAEELAALVVPPGLDDRWLAALPDGVRRLTDDPPLSVGQLDEADGVVTGCAVAIARTGTLVLDAGPGQGRRALTLVPDWHLCVVAADQVVPSVPDGIARLDPRRPLTFVSGPSATSDIELQRVEGVHGPRTLVVVLVDDEASLQR